MRLSITTPPSFRGRSTNIKREKKAFVLLKTISPVAWQHIDFHGHYTFCGSRDPIDLDAMLANLTLEEGEHSLSPIVDSIRLGPKMSLEIA